LSSKKIKLYKNFYKIKHCTVKIWSNAGRNEKRDWNIAGESQPDAGISLGDCSADAWNGTGFPIISGYCIIGKRVNRLAPCPFLVRFSGF
jgi:hypothetical protein